MTGCEVPQNRILRQTRILHLVHLDPRKSAPPAFQHVRVLVKQMQHTQLQVSEIDRVILPQLMHIGSEPARELEPLQHNGIKTGLAQQPQVHFVRRLPHFLISRQPRLPGHIEKEEVHRFGLFPANVDAGCGKQPRDHLRRVLFVIDDEIAVESGGGGLGAQDRRAQSVECRNGDLGGQLAAKRDQAVFHLTRRLVGERQAE